MCSMEGRPRLSHFTTKGRELCLRMGPRYSACSFHSKGGGGTVGEQVGSGEGGSFCSWLLFRLPFIMGRVRRVEAIVRKGCCFVEDEYKFV